MAVLRLEQCSSLGLSPELVKAMAKVRPRTEEELKRYVEVFLGFRLEDRPVVEGHNSPLEFLADVFFERVERALLFANRGSGKTRLLSILHLLNSVHKPGCWSVNVGSIEEQGRRGYRYFSEYLVEGGVYEDELVAPPSMERTEFKNGSVVEMVSGSAKSLSSPRPHKLAADEIDHWEAEVFEIASQCTSGDDRIIAQTILVSSRYYEFGLLSRLLDEADERGIRVYRWCVWDVMERCDGPETGRCKVCPLYEWVHPVKRVKEKLCGGEIGPRCRGHVPVRDVVDKFLLGSPYTFYTQQLLGEASREGLVFGEFGPENVREPEGLELSYCAGVDFGYAPGHPAVIEVLGEDSAGGLWFVDEWWREGALPSLHREAAKEMMERWGIEIFWCDPSRPDIIATWQEAGLPASACPKHRIVEGIARMKDRILAADGSRHLFVSPRCKQLLRAMRKCYRYKRRADGTFSEEPSKECSDAVDAARYAIMGGVGGWSDLYAPHVSMVRA